MQISEIFHIFCSVELHHYCSNICSSLYAMS